MPDERDFEREVLDRLIKIETQIGSWDNAKKQAYDNQKDIITLQQQATQQQEDINELKEGNKWLKRTSAGAVISALASAIIAIVIAAF